MASPGMRRTSRSKNLAVASRHETASAGIAADAIAPGESVDRGWGTEWQYRVRTDLTPASARRGVTPRLAQRCGREVSLPALELGRDERRRPDRRFAQSSGRLLPLT